jgi:hypothetical protein
MRSESLTWFQIVDVEISSSCWNLILGVPVLSQPCRNLKSKDTAANSYTSSFMLANRHSVQLSNK